MRARKCSDCHAKDATRECRRCHEQRPRVDFLRGGKICAGCRAAPPPSWLGWRPRACFRCHETKTPEAFPFGPSGRKRSTVCQSCHDRAEREKVERTARRKATRVRDGILERRCSKCSKWKPQEGGYSVTRYTSTGRRVVDSHCLKCRAKDSAARVKARKGDPEFRRRRAEAQRRYRARHREKVREWDRLHRERLKADPQRAQERREAQRIAYRLRREQEGGELADVRAHRPRGNDRERFGSARVPLAPLLPLVQGYVDANAREVETGSGRRTRMEVTALADLGLSSRQWHSWRNGVRWVEVKDADAVLVGLGLNPWDVWDGGDLAAFGVEPATAIAV
jgi:hypothetical protein